MIEVEQSFIWEGIKRGDKAALKILHNRYFQQMCLYAVRSLQNSTGLAEELVDDCFIKLWENRRRIEIHTSLKNYLFLMLHNAIIDHIRKKKLMTEPLAGDYPFPGDEKEFDDQK